MEDVSEATKGSEWRSHARAEKGDQLGVGQGRGCRQLLFVFLQKTSRRSIWFPAAQPLRPSLGCV